MIVIGKYCARNHRAKNVEKRAARRHHQVNHRRVTTPCHPQMFECGDRGWGQGAAAEVGRLSPCPNSARLPGLPAHVRKAKTDLAASSSINRRSISSKYSPRRWENSGRNEIEGRMK